jgi:hypothetical protein
MGTSVYVNALMLHGVDSVVRFMDGQSIEVTDINCFYYDAYGKHI